MRNIMYVIAALQTVPVVEEHEQLIEKTIECILNPDAQDSEVITVVGEHTLRRGILRCLGPTEWLSCEVLDAYFYLLQRRANEACEKMMFLPTHFYTMITKPSFNFNNGLQYFRDKNPFDCDLVFVPINQGEEHWVIVVVNVKAKQMHFYDPLLQLNAKKVELANVNRFFNDLSRIRGLAKLNVPLWAKVVVTDIAKQDDDYNCGVYVLLYAEHISRRTGLPLQIDPTTLVQKRKSILMTLFRKESPSAL